VCHGYGQLANYFIGNFEVLQNEQTIVVAPEGLHRFYWEKFSGRVVASWMTKEDREDDIKDYINYLNHVYKEVLDSVKDQNVKIHVLGFSQGTATVCRWLASGNVRVDNLILWAGFFPEDMNFKINKNAFDSVKITLAIGDDDEFINDVKVKEQEMLLNKNDISYDLLRFSGKHIIPAKPLLQLAERFRSKKSL
jgi:predicted esterase